MSETPVIYKDQICTRCLAIHEGLTVSNLRRCEATINPRSNKDGSMHAIYLQCGGELQVLRRIYGAGLPNKFPLGFDEGTPVMVIKEDDTGPVPFSLCRVPGLPWIMFSFETKLLKESNG